MTRPLPAHELYQRVIIEHSRCPKNFHELDDATYIEEGNNPLCGDRFKIYLQIDKDTIIEKISFQGKGCSLSFASASMMTANLKGKSVSEAMKISDEFYRLILRSPGSEEKEDTLGKLKVFSGVWRYPSRIRCVSLSWHIVNRIFRETTQGMSLCMNSN